MRSSHLRWRAFGGLLAVVSLLTVSAAWSQETERPGPAHPEQLLFSQEQETPPPSASISPFAPSAPLPLAATPTPSPDFVVFGYAQNYTVSGGSMVSNYRWNALTHVGTTFVGFNASGALTGVSTNFTNRPAELKAGGAAAAAGVKVIMVVNNFDDSPGGVIETVMTSDGAGSPKETLVNNIVSTVTSDAYCQGVSLDLEFSWGTTVRDGVTDFFHDLRLALPSQYEISVYTNGFYNGNQWNVDPVTGLTPYVDYMLYSCYDWGSSSTSHAISDFNSFIPQVNSYINAGMPPEKIVLTLSAYGRQWFNTSSATYGGTSSSRQSMGWVDGFFNTTLRVPPYVRQYVTGDETAWYTWNDGVNNVAVYDDPESMEMKIRLALSMQDGGGNNNGRRLGGVAFWSLRWMNQDTFSANPSYDPVAAVNVARWRTYPHIFQLLEEILHPPGRSARLFESFEGLNPSWRDPNESPDSVNDGPSSISLAVSPGGSGAPPDTANALRMDFNLTGSGKIFFRHEVLRPSGFPTINDVNAAIAHFDANSQVDAYVDAAAPYAGRTLRMIVADANRELEMSPQFSLATPGWHLFSWDLTAPGAVSGYTTTEPAFVSGNGVLNTAGGGAKDISFIGFLLEGGAGSGTLYFDELSYEHVNPGGKDYKINEFRYNGTGSTGGGEFVEIFGPSGAFPTNTQLRFYDSTDGSVLSSVNLGGQSVPADGHFVIGDNLGIGNVDLVPGGWSTSTDDIPDAQPSAIQIYNTSTGCVYDSVTYKAMGGLADLIRQQTHGVTGESYAWCGEQGPGTNAAGAGYALGRYPDGADTNVNENDFSSVPATPGTANGGSVALGSTFDFSSTPSVLFQTYDLIDGSHILDPTSAGLPASPNLGNAWRCVDTAGGGVVGVLGDPALGSAGDGYTVTGQLYVPAGAAPAQAVAVGICGRQGSTFFTNFPDNSGYESGYWLLYENAAVGLDNGAIPDNVGKFQALWARNDRMQSASTTPLGTPLTVAGGQWVTFSLTVNPNLDPAQGLIFTVNGSDVYRGSIPSGGPISGAFQVGFRENHAGGPAAAEGTWIDNLAFGGAVPVGLSLLGAD